MHCFMHLDIANRDKCGQIAKMLALRKTQKKDIYRLLESIILQSKCHHSNITMLLRRNPFLETDVYQVNL